MSTNSFAYGEIQRVVQQAITSGAVSEAQRWSWENRIAKDPRAVGQLRLAKPPTHSMPPEPEPNAYVARSGGQQLQEWISAQKDFGQSSGEPIPERPAWHDPSTTASGIDIAAVNRLDWRVRHQVAREADRAMAQSLIETYSGPDGDIEAEIASQPGHPASLDVEMYSMAVDAWRNNPAVPMSEVERDLARSRPDDGTYNPAYSRGPDNSPEAAYEHLAEMYAEVEALNPGMSFKPPSKTSIHVNKPI